MVSGFVTSPLDHERIWSGEASEMRMALNSLTSSTYSPDSRPEMLMPRLGSLNVASSTKRIASSLSLSTSTLSPSDWSSLMSTLNDSGTPGGWMSSPFTIASYVWTRPMTSSDLTVRSSCRMEPAPYASSAQTSISPNRCPPNGAFPPSGCWVMSEYGPVERAWILSSTRWC